MRERYSSMIEIDVVELEMLIARRLKINNKESKKAFFKYMGLWGKTFSASVKRGTMRPVLYYALEEILGRPFKK